MLWLMAFHIIAVVAWFAGLFYLPRLFVYHSQCIVEGDSRGSARFKVMERKLFRFIMTPSGIIATVLGLAIIAINPSYYLSQGWLHAKLTLVILLWIFHIHTGLTVKRFANDQNSKSERFYRWYNEFPTFILVGAVILVVIKPF